HGQRVPHPRARQHALQRFPHGARGRPAVYQAGTGGWAKVFHGSRRRSPRICSRCHTAIPIRTIARTRLPAPRTMRPAFTPAVADVSRTMFTVCDVPRALATNAADACRPSEDAVRTSVSPSTKKSGTIAPREYWPEESSVLPESTTEVRAFWSVTVAPP